MSTTDQLPEPELGYIQTDKSNQPAFSARQMREAMKHATTEPVGEIKWAANVPNSIREAVFYDLVPPIGTKLYTTPQPAQATQAEVTDEREAFESCALMEGSLFKRRADDPDKYWDGNVQDDWELWQARAILALRPERVPMTERELELIDAAVALRGDHAALAALIREQIATGRSNMDVGSGQHWARGDELVTRATLLARDFSRAKGVGTLAFLAACGVTP